MQFTLLALIAAVLFTASCARKEEKAPTQKPPVPVTVGKVTQRTIPVQVRAIGNVEAYSTISVKAEVSGQLTRVYFTEGDSVRKGQLLFEIDPRPAEEQVRQLEANLAKDSATLAHARNVASRYGELFRQGIIAKQQYEQVNTDATALEAGIKADQAAIANARLQVQYSAIHSPIDGRTGNLLVKQGNLVKANDTGPLVVINQIHPIYVSFSVPESELPAIKSRIGSGLAVRALVKGAGNSSTNQDGDGQAARGKLTFIDNTVDMSTGTIKLKATFPNQDNRLWPGQFVNVVLTVSTQANAILVPSQAVQTGQKGQFVYVVKPDQKVELRPVIVNRPVGDEIALASGLQPGETIVTDGQSRLSPGARVEVLKSAAGAGSNAAP